MFGTLDKYIMKKFFLNFAYWIIGFVFIAVVVDIGENVDRLIKSEAPLGEIIFRYYIPFCIFFGNLLSPFLVFLSIIWVASNMAQKSELIAVLSGGISFNRMIRPFMVVAVLISAFTLISSNYIVPKSNKIKYDFETEYTRSLHNFGQNIHRELQPGVLYYFSHIRTADSVGYDFSREIWDKGQLREKLKATRAEFLPDTMMWELKNVEERTFDKTGKESYNYTRDTVMSIDMRMADFGLPDEIMMNMNSRELDEFLEQEKMKGSEKITLIEVEKNSRPANAISIIILAFMGVSIASRKVRGGIGIHLLISVILAALFIFSAKISSVAAMNVDFPADVAVWIPNIIFLALACYIYWKAPK